MSVILNSLTGIWFVYKLQAKRGTGGEQKLGFTQRTTGQYSETGNDTNPENAMTGRPEI